MRRLAALALAAGLAACAPPAERPAAPAAGPDRLTLTPVAFDQLPGWQADRVSAVLPALLKSCERITKLPPDRAIGFEGVGGVAGDWYGPCAAARRIGPGDDQGARAMFEGWFTPWMAANNTQAEGLFTGYFEPEITGSRTRHGRFSMPIYGRPSDAVTVELGRFRQEWAGESIVGRLDGAKLEPYPARAEIEAGAIDGKAPVLLWAEDPVDLHIMHIQGSGRVRLDDGQVVRLGVAGSNGRKFVGIGKVLKDEGKLDDTSMPAIRGWLKAHPAEARALLAKNPRYIFYSLGSGDGPVGTEGVALTPERSLAVDPRFVPLGAPLWLDTVDPAGQPLRRAMIAQDTGAAIKGPVRGDVFWGSGEAAFDKAGRMKSRGRLFLLLPRQRSPKLAAAQ
ncbi:MAG: murein transglycosylase A [Actinomycetota bacterium]